MDRVVGVIAAAVALAGCSSAPSPQTGPTIAATPLDAPPIGVDVPDDGAARLTAVLGSTTRATLDRDVAAAFADGGLFTSTQVVGERWIAAVGRVGGGDCLVAVREAGGAVTFPSFPREWLMPGELGCSTALVTSPPR